MPFQEFGHQSVDRPATRGYDLQNLGARPLVIEGALHCFNLAPEPPNAGQELLLVSDCVSRNPS